MTSGTGLEASARRTQPRSPCPRPRPVAGATALAALPTRPHAPRTHAATAPTARMHRAPHVHAPTSSDVNSPMPVSSHVSDPWRSSATIAARRRGAVGGWVTLFGLAAELTYCILCEKWGSGASGAQRQQTHAVHTRPMARPRRTRPHSQHTKPRETLFAIACSTRRTRRR